jgi:hypothetical protein
MHPEAKHPRQRSILTLCRSKRRRRSGGLTAIEELLAIAAVAGCFIYPLSIAATGSGRQIAAQVEQAHEAILRQR